MRQSIGKHQRNWNGFIRIAEKIKGMLQIGALHIGKRFAAVVDM